MQACDLAEAETSSAEADAIAAQYDLAPLQWSALARRAWRCALAGHLHRAERRIQEASDFGNARGVSHAPEAARLQRVTLRWQQDRMAELVPIARAVNDDYANRTPGVSVILARALVEHASGHDEARVLLKELADDGFAKLPLGTFWSSALIVGAEAACLLDLPEVCGTIRDLLEPFIDQVAFTGLFVTAPIAYGVAVAAAGCGDDRAPKFFRHAAEIADRIHAPVLAARARAYPLARPR